MKRLLIRFRNLPSTFLKLNLFKLFQLAKKLPFCTLFLSFFPSVAFYATQKCLQHGTKMLIFASIQKV